MTHTYQKTCATSATVIILLILIFNLPSHAQAIPNDQKAGSVLVFPYYTSRAATQTDTRLSISNVGPRTTYFHIFLIDGSSCQPADLFLCFTPNASVALKASEYDPEMTGWFLGVAVNLQGIPIQNNALIGNAFLTEGEYVNNYNAEAFWARDAGLATVDIWTATLNFNGIGYDQIPNQLEAEIQSPLDAPNQKLVTVGLSGDLTGGQISGATQVGPGLVYNGNEVPFASFSLFLNGNCQAFGTVSTTNPRVPFGMARLIPAGQVGTMKIGVGAAVGLLFTSRSGKWNGIRPLHKLAFTNSTLTIPLFPPVC